jgi:hypothetical protein
MEAAIFIPLLYISVILMNIAKKEIIAAHNII